MIIFKSHEVTWFVAISHVTLFHTVNKSFLLKKNAQSSFDSVLMSKCAIYCSLTQIVF